MSGCTAAPQAGHVSCAVELFRRSASVHGVPDQRAYVTLISRLVKVSRRGQSGAPQRLAHHFWLELREAHEQSLDEASFRAGINACVETGRLGDAENLIRTMRERGLRPGHGAYNMLIKFHAQRGDMEGARRAFKDMRQWHGSPDIVSYNTLIAGYCKQRDLTRARAVIDKARYEGVQLDAWSYSSYLQVCGRGQCMADMGAWLHGQAGCSMGLPWVHVRLGEGVVWWASTSLARRAIGVQLWPDFGASVSTIYDMAHACMQACDR